MMQFHVEPSPINLLKGKYNYKSDKSFVELKNYRDLTSATSYLYEFNMTFFDNGDPEEIFCLCKTSTFL